ncbi:P-loop containing nucleoside triphosphate hydrolase protein [Penicillium frequentans]|uniref:P-loop containing nucleoside triphosphate hydrolase protein n=1 Tax=Penicillium frequentans TaxID=3151616 RepID=A0AAD6D403_9EURO|nr:P-loop containing nucleoside triphosphate hydrolase protein [Penicillium glabrum]
MSFNPFAESPTRPKQVISLGFYRTGSHSLKKALAIPGYREALTDVTPFAEPLLKAFPEARVILVNRDFESWMKSFQESLVLPASEGFLAWLSGNVMEPFMGLQITQTACKMYMGLLGVFRME